MTKEGFAQAFQSGFRRTVSLLRSRGASHDNAEDSAQAAWLRGWESLHQLRDDSMILSWVNTIAINVHRRRSQYEARYEALSDLRGQVGIDLAAIDAARILALCRPRDRMLFEQRMGGLTTDEMAESQGVSPTAIRVRLLRARRVTRERVEKRAMALRLPVESGSALPL